MLQFIVNSLPNLVNNLSEGTHKNKWKYRNGDKKRETCRIKYTYFHCFVEYKNFKDDLLERKCLCCDKKYQQKFILVYTKINKLIMFLLA